MKKSLAAGALAVAIGNIPVTDAATLTTLHIFNGTNGLAPSGLLLDAAGNFYGTTIRGGTSSNCTAGCGTVFQLSPPAPGKTQWTEKVLVNFRSSNGSGPSGPLTIDQTGNLYGTTGGGGSPFCDCGTVFKLSPPVPGSTSWSQKILLTFDGANGKYPSAVIMDRAGNLFGTAATGFHDSGSVFQLSPPAPTSPNWLYSALIQFKGRNGAFPNSVMIGQAGNLYGTTEQGGFTTNCANLCGTVFRLSPPAPGTTKWAHQILLSFNNSNGATPSASLIMDQAGNLYGTTAYGGLSYYRGVAFQLSSPAPGTTKWPHKTLVNFNGANGRQPFAGLVMDQAGNLYGSTSQGGSSTNCSDGCGTVFQLSPPVAGSTKWSYKKLVDFNGTNGAWPSAALVIDKAGNLYGTTEGGGPSTKCPDGCGTVFRIKP